MENNTEENKNTNSLFLIITVIVIVALGIFWFTKMGKNVKGNQIVEPISTADIDRSEILSAEDLCYLSIENTPQGLTDVYALSVSISEDGTTRGELMTSPAEKDKMEGKIYGKISNTQDGKVFDGWYDNSAEGLENTDQLMIKILDDKALIGYGEMVQAGEAYVYKDVKNINYSLELPAIHCGMQKDILSKM